MTRGSNNDRCLPSSQDVMVIYQLSNQLSGRPELTNAVDITRLLSGTESLVEAERKLESSRNIKG
jgi:hypothetical protein